MGCSPGWGRRIPRGISEGRRAGHLPLKRHSMSASMCERGLLTIAWAGVLTGLICSTFFGGPGFLCLIIMSIFARRELLRRIRKEDGRPVGGKARIGVVVLRVLLVGVVIYIAIAGFTGAPIPNIAWNLHSDVILLVAATPIVLFQLYRDIRTVNKAAA